MKELDFLDEWELVREDGKVVTIFCKLCKIEGKEQRPIKSNTNDKMMSLGEQHRFFRHQRDAVGYPVEAEFYSLQCPRCKWFFPVKRILESHEKTCTGPVGRLEAVKNAGSKQSDIVASTETNGDVDDVEKKPLIVDVVGTEDSVANDTTKASKTTQPKAAQSKVLNSQGASAANGVVGPDESDVLSATMETALSQHKVTPCKVVLARTAVAEDMVKKRKFDSTGKENAAPAKRLKQYGKAPDPVKSEPEPPPRVLDDEEEYGDDDNDNKVVDVKVGALPSDVLSLGNKWWENEAMNGGFACPLCKTRPLSKPVFIEDHVAAHHFKQRRYVCVLCREEGLDLHRWSHKSTLEDHLRKTHPKEYRANKEESGKELTEVMPLLPDVVNVMRLFFKIYPRKGETVKEAYQAKKPPFSTSEDNTKKSKCPECDQKFYTRESRTVIDHIMWRHRNVPRYHCSHCDDGAGFGMVAGFEDHCKKDHGCDKTDYLRPLFMKVDRVAEDLLDRFKVGAVELKAMHDERVVVSDDEDGDEIVQIDLGIDDNDVKHELDDVIDPVKRECDVDA